MESGFCSFAEGTVLIFLDMFLWAREKEKDVNESKEKQVTHAQSVCIYHSEYPEDCSHISRQEDCLCWHGSESRPLVHRQPGHRHHSPLCFLSLNGLTAHLGGGGNEKEYPPGVYNPQGICSALRDPAHPERAAPGLCWGLQVTSSAWLNKGEREKISKQLHFPARFHVHP